MFRRIAGFVLFLILVGVLTGAVIATGLAAVSGPARWLIVGLTVLGLVLFAALARRIFRRTWAPVGELIDATRRLGEGDLRVRLRTARPGPFAVVSRSFNRMAERLEEEDVRRRRLLSDIGHELRTPMTVIRGEVEAVLDGLHQPEQLSNVVDEIDLIDRLLDDLRLLSMAEAGTLLLEKEPTNLGELARSVLASFSKIIASRNIDVVMDIGQGDNEAMVDPHRIHQVLSNIVANAIDQMLDGGRLDVTVSIDSTRATIEIADTGSGIPEDDLVRVFDRFARSPDSTGTGLGLSISRDLVEAHGGTITAGNRDGGGAVFTVTLPVE